MNSTHVEPNLRDADLLRAAWRTRIVTVARRSAQKSCRLDNTRINLNIPDPVINAVLMAPRFQFHARLAYHHHYACIPALFRTIPIVIRSLVNFTRRDSSVFIRRRTEKQVVNALLPLPMNAFIFNVHFT